MPKTVFKYDKATQVQDKRYIKNIRITKCPYQRLFSKGSSMLNSLQMKANYFSSKGFMKISTNYKLV